LVSPETVIRSAERKPEQVQHPRGTIKGPTVAAKELSEFAVTPDNYHVSPEPILITAELRGALALCVHDEGRGVGGLLHLPFLGDSGRPSDITDNTLSSILVVLDRFKRAVVGNTSRRDDIQARIIAHALPPLDAREPRATLVDLIKADLAEGKIVCGTQLMRRDEPVRVCFEPFEGRLWITGPTRSRSAARGARSA
jgi:chemotaxis receptor (MCP) glutamine deamidase CheD